MKNRYLITEHEQLSCSFDDFIEGLKSLRLKEIKLTSPSYSTIYRRYAWGKPNKFQLGLSIRSNAYISHATAMIIHKLSSHEETHIYINSEQSVKPQASSSLEQGRIDNAFKGKSRKSQYAFPYDNFEFLLLNGKNTNNLGVEGIIVSNNKTVNITNIERTLIDITVRPIYSGGVNNILAAYKKAKRKVSIDTMLDMLKNMNYAYPYHQSIGLYLDMAGYKKESLDKVHSLGLMYDFYLDYNMKKTTYSKKWRVHYPKELLE